MKWYNLIRNPGEKKTQPQIHKFTTLRFFSLLITIKKNFAVNRSIFFSLSLREHFLRDEFNGRHTHVLQITGYMKINKRSHLMRSNILHIYRTQLGCLCCVLNILKNLPYERNFSFTLFIFSSSCFTNQLKHISIDSGKVTS